MSYPVFVPSRSIDVTSSSPAPSSAAFCAHATASTLGRPGRGVAEDLVSVLRPLRVDRDDDALRAEDVGELGDEPGLLEGRRVHRHLVCPARQGEPRVAHAPYPSAHREGDVQARGHAPDEGAHRRPLLQARGDVQEDHLVRPLVPVAGRELDRVARVPQPLELHALHDPPRLDVQAGDDPLREGHLCVPPISRLRVAQLDAAVVERPPDDGSRRPPPLYLDEVVQAPDAPGREDLQLLARRRRAPSASPGPGPSPSRPVPTAVASRLTTPAASNLLAASSTPTPWLAVQPLVTTLPSE